MNDQVQWNAPSDVEAGDTGDFFGIDQHRLRILRLQPPDKLVTSYSLESLGEQTRGAAVAFRVWEAGKRFVTAWPRGMIHALSFDGSAFWSLQGRPAGENLGGFDLDDEGKLYLLSNGDDVRVFDVEGKPAGEVKLQSDARGKLSQVTDLRVRGGELIVKRTSPDTLFEVYDRSTGTLLRRIDADVETLRVTYPSPVWTAGQSIPFTIDFDARQRQARPKFRVWLRPLGVPEFQELPWEAGRVTVPADARGLYQVRVTPDVRGRVAEYIVDGYIEIRVPDSVGIVAILTPLNRFNYGAREALPVRIVARAAVGTKIPETIVVRLQDASAQVLAERIVKLAEGKGDCEFQLKEISGQRLKSESQCFRRRATRCFWRAGCGASWRRAAAASGGGLRCVLDANVPGFTVASQPIEIGPGLGGKRPLKIVQHGDYTLGFPTGPRPVGMNLPQWADLPDAIADHVSRSRTLGLNLFVDRVGQGAGLGGLSQEAQDPELVERLTADPTAVAPEKADSRVRCGGRWPGTAPGESRNRESCSYMDAGLPLGTLFDSRKPEQMEKDLETATRQMLSYPAFRGWSWAANWWLEKHGAAAAIGEAEKVGVHRRSEKRPRNRRLVFRAGRGFRPRLSRTPWTPKIGSAKCLSRSLLASSA